MRENHGSYFDTHIGFTFFMKTFFRHIMLFIYKLYIISPTHYIFLILNFSKNVTLYDL